MSLSGNIRAGAAYVEVTAETSRLRRGLKNAQLELQNFGRSCTAVGKDLLALSAAAAIPIGLAVKSFADFDDRMRLVKAVTKSTAAEFESLTKVAARLGRETSFTAKQVADGMVSLGRMGFSQKEIEQAIQPTLDLARATGTDLGEAADIAANSMRIFGIEAGKMSSVADVLTATANGSAQTLTDLFEALKMAGPQAKAAGENITDTSAAIGVLANLGIKGSLAGTALRKSFSQFAKSKVQDQLKAVGVETVDASGNLRKMADIMTGVGRVMNAMPTAERLSFAEDIFDIRGSLAGLTLGGNSQELESFAAMLKNVQGTARNTAEEMDAGLGGGFRKLSSAVEGAMNAVGKALESTLQPLTAKLTDATLAVIKWIEANGRTITIAAAAAAGLAALGAGLIAVGMAAKGVAAGIAAFSGVLKGFIYLKAAFVGAMAAMSAAMTVFKMAAAAGIGTMGALKIAVASFFATNPAGWIIAVGAALAGVCVWLSQAAKYTASLSDKMSTLRQKGDEQRQTDQKRMERLNQLADKEKLNNAELAEAESLTSSLTSRYGEFGAAVDKAAGKLNLAADAQSRLNEKMKQAALAELDAEIAEYRNNIKELQNENESLLGYWNHNLWSQISGGEEEANKKLELNGDRIVEYMKKIGAVQERMRAVNGGDEDAVTGTGDLDERIMNENQRKTAVSEVEKSFQSSVAETAQRWQSEEFDRRLEDAVSNNPSAGTAALERLVNSYAQLAEQLKNSFSSSLSEAESDGTVDENEREQLDLIRQGYEKAESLFDKYSEKLREAREGTLEASEKIKPQGSFFADALSRLASDGGDARRTATAAEEIARNGKETNRLLKTLDLGLEFT